MEHKCKIILDRKLKTDINSTIYKQGKIFVFYDENIDIENNARENITYIPTKTKNNKLDIEFILNKLYDLGIMSILVESGGELNGSFMPYIDKLYHFIAPKILGDNSGKSCFDGNKIDKISNCTNLIFENSINFPPDILVIYNKQ